MGMSIAQTIEMIYLDKTGEITQRKIEVDMPLKRLSYAHNRLVGGSSPSGSAYQKPLLCKVFLLAIGT